MKRALTDTQKAKMRAYSAILRQSPAYRAKQREHMQRYLSDPAKLQRAREQSAAKAAIWRTKPTNKARVAARRRERWKDNPQFALAAVMRSRIGCEMRKAKGTKSANMAKLIGCTMDFLRADLESLFLPGMSWKERDKWHIDHIRPCASFDLSDPEQQAICFHWTNLQPLWVLDNLRKADKA